MSTTLIENGTVYLPGGVLRRASLVLRGDRIAAVMDAEGGPPAPERVHKVIDARGRFVLPGFVDTHIHLASLALRRVRCDLAPARSVEDLLDRVRAWARRTDSPRIQGVDWDESTWERPEPPTRDMLDGVEQKRPLLVRRICGHAGVANTALLEQLSGPGDLVDRDTGYVREHALWEASRLTEPGPEALVAHMEAAIRDLHRLGVTGIHDIITEHKLDAYLAGLSESKAPLWIDGLLQTTPERFSSLARDAGAVTGFRAVGIKCFLDGSLGGRTAALNAPYTDGSGRGTLLMDDADLERTLRACRDGGFACAMHAIGDRAIDQALAAVGRVAGSEDARSFRIEHCEIVGPAQLERLETAPVFLAVQPNFARKWGERSGVYQACLGEARWRQSNPYRTFLESGIEFVFGSDGMPPGPLFGLKGATAHPNPGERLSPKDAIDRYTALPNTVGLHGRDAGVIEENRIADLVLLDENPLTTDPDDITVCATFVGGTLVYERQ